MAYLNQVDAYLHNARDRLAYAKSQVDTWSGCSRTLARALEYGTAALFSAWGDPRTATPKIHEPFYRQVAPLIDEQHTHLIKLLWETEGTSLPPGDVRHVLSLCGQTITYLAELAGAKPLDGWEPPSTPRSIGWDGLSDWEQTFLRTVWSHANYWSPGVCLVLFGSRAAGLARPDSDYDILFIFPEDTPDSQRRYSIGDVNSYARQHDVVVDIEESTDRQWARPDDASRPLLERIKTCGVQIPH